MKQSIDEKYVLDNGFKLDDTTPKTVVGYVKNVGKGHVYIRFVEGIAVGLYAYTDGPKDENIRKVVLSETTVTRNDLKLVKQLCNLN